MTTAQSGQFEGIPGGLAPSAMQSVEPGQKRIALEARHEVCYCRNVAYLDKRGRAQGPAGGL